MVHHCQEEYKHNYKTNMPYKEPCSKETNQRTQYEKREARTWAWAWTWALARLYNQFLGLANQICELSKLTLDPTSYNHVFRIIQM